MTGLAGTDIAIALDLAEGRVVRVSIVPRRLPSIGALVAGRSAADMLKLVPMLFTLCAAAHGVAAQTAVDAARGIDATPAVRRKRAAAVLSERLVEQLRGVVTGLGLLEQGSVAAAMRELISASATFAFAANAGMKERLSAIVRIELALDQIGITRLNSTDKSVAVRFSPSGKAYLSFRDDLEVIARMARDGARYANAPDIDGAIPETGSWARLCAEAAIDGEPSDRIASARVVALPQSKPRVAGSITTSNLMPTVASADSNVWRRPSGTFIPSVHWRGCCAARRLRSIVAAGLRLSS